MSDDEITEAHAAEYMANLKTYFDKVRERYGPQAIVTDTDPTTVLRFTRQPATVTTTCARCSATIDPAAVEQHHERCFVVGDWVRWEANWAATNWVEGEITRVGRYVSISISNEGPGRTRRGGVQEFGTDVDGCTIRHIWRPGRAVAEPTISRECDHGEAKPLVLVAADGSMTASHPVGKYRAPHVLSVKITTPEPNCTINGVPAHCPQPAPTLYDGLTAMECLDAYQIYMQGDRFKWQPGERMKLDRYMTPAQLAAARDLWQQQLRSRISAAKERERLSVTYCEVDVDE